MNRKLKFYVKGFPVPKRTFIKEFLGFIRIFLNKDLKEKKDNGEFYTEKEYLEQVKKVLNSLKESLE